MRIMTLLSILLMGRQVMTVILIRTQTILLMRTLLMEITNNYN